MSNLPLQLSRFLGREREIAQVKERLAENRLVTLTGSGGVGKTRLALQVADQLADGLSGGAWLIELAGLSDPSLVAPAIASALELVQEGAQPVAERLSGYLQPLDALIVLDNCEHLLAGAAEIVARLLGDCPRLRILATSREPLNLSGEIAMLVPSLSLPQANAQAGAEDSEAVQLFVDRAAAAWPEFGLTEENSAAVAGICRRLDGIPLAIELAAARIRVLTPKQMAERLDDRFSLLISTSRSVIPRHQTLRSLIDWSYDLLSPSERQLFQRLSVFSSGWSLEAAEGICADDPPEAGSEIRRAEVLDVLGQLIEKSLVTPGEQHGERRFRLLETLRQYAFEKLEQSGELPQLRNRFLRWFADLVEAKEGTSRTAGQAEWYGIVEMELDNMRSALQWAKSDPSQLAGGLQLSGSLQQFWWLHGYGTEGRAWLDGLLRLDPEGKLCPPVVRAGALQASAFLARRQGDTIAARGLFEPALALWRELGQSPGIAFCLRELGRLALQEGDPRTARPLLEESLELGRARGERTRVYEALYGLANVERAEGNLAKAAALHVEALDLEEQQGDEWYVHLTHLALGSICLETGDLAAARDHLEESLGLTRKVGEKAGVALNLPVFARLLAAEGAQDRAVRLASAAAVFSRAIGRGMDVEDVSKSSLWLEAARGRLGARAFTAAWAEGQQLSLEQAVAYALEGGYQQPTSRGDVLTPREREVAALIASGHSNREIASTLVIADRTAETHVEHILGKLGLSSRVQIAAWAVEQGLLSPSP